MDLMLTNSNGLLLRDSKLQGRAESRKEGSRSFGDTLVSTDTSHRFFNPKSGKFSNNNHTNFAAYIQNRMKALRVSKFVYLLD